MPERRRAGLWVAGIVGGTVTAAAGIHFFRAVQEPRAFTPSGVQSVADLGSSSLDQLNQSLKDSDPQALEILQKRVTPQQGETLKALTPEEAGQWLASLDSLRAGFFRLSAPGKATAAAVACRILDRFTIEPAPSQWIDALPPVHDILSACLGDADGNVRFVALTEAARLWTWTPARPLIPTEENELGLWKERIHRPVVRCLASKDIRTKISAIGCLGMLPVDSAAAPAVAYLDDEDSIDARRQTLVSFAQRPALLTEDMLLRRLHDSDQSIRDTAAVVLKARGLSRELISLGGLMVSPKPQQRASVISLIKNRTDIDTTVWLLQLSHDADESVRIQAVEALAAQESAAPSVKRRLAEMARSDSSKQVRETASKFVPSVEETTASLPPLPGSPSLNPKAN